MARKVKKIEDLDTAVSVDAELENPVLDPVVPEINPKLVTVRVTVCKDENGNFGKEVNGIVSKDGKTVTTLEGVTFAL